jgi:hypothetical protein
MPGFSGRDDEPPARPPRVIPLGRLDPATIHRARAINADALRIMDGVLDRVADRIDRL